MVSIGRNMFVDHRGSFDQGCWVALTEKKVCVVPVQVLIKFNNKNTCMTRIMAESTEEESGENMSFAKVSTQIVILTATYNFRMLRQFDALELSSLRRK
jgi:hypothetical protein